MQWLIVPTVIRPLADGSSVSGSWKTAIVTVAFVLVDELPPLLEAHASRNAASAPPLRATPPSAPAAFRKRRRESAPSCASAAKALNSRETSGSSLMSSALPKPAEPPDASSRKSPGALIRAIVLAPVRQVNIGHRSRGASTLKTAAARKHRLGGRHDHFQLFFNGPAVPDLDGGRCARCA